MSRGRLRVYLGAAPGVGKTFAMLGEGRRAQERGRDVVVGGGGAPPPPPPPPPPQPRGAGPPP
ncbi:hypothetical protein ACIBH1_49005 [Nonomuraea sp. NPDC050663]|uniref:hypothetical protein n=1 Tax=Nonomuraea sp. NPDC050663 TaxID=3364370 RepID=UPI0037B89C9C